MARVPPIVDGDDDRARTRASSRDTDGNAADGTRRATVEASLASGVTHVAVLADDVDVVGLDLLSYLDAMDSSGFGISSPSFAEFDRRPFMAARAECASHRTDFVDVLFAVFARGAWGCWQSLLDPVGNGYGWGTDLAVSDLCRAPAGILDGFRAFHRGNRTYPHRIAARQMHSWLAKAAGLARAEDRLAYRRCVCQHRPASFGRCERYRNGTRPGAGKATTTTTMTPGGARDTDCLSQLRKA
jgi:hypothetical protein